MSQTLEIPEGISCTYESFILKCKKDQDETQKEIKVPEVEIIIKDNKITIECKKGNKVHYKKIMAFKAHINNLFKGLNEKYVYELEAVNVHFPMTLKINGELLTIQNFLGEKVPRHAKILPDVKVDIKGQKITISSVNIENAGQTASNFEKATKIKGKDRRIFQDGIHIVSKPRRAK